MPKPILFPTDFSSAADHAFIYALQLADKLNTPIYTLHSYSLPDVRGAHLPHTLQEVYDSMDMEELETYQDNIPHLRRIAESNNMGHVDIKHILAQGSVLDTINTYADRENAQVIVMGTTGATGLKALIGSTAGEVMEKAPCPVLGVPDEAKFDGNINNIAITTNFQDEEIKALNWLIGFTETFDCQYHVFNVDLGKIESFRNRMEAFREKCGDRDDLNFYVLDGTDFNETAVRFFNEHHIDLLGMITHRRNFFQELFRFSYAKNLIYHTELPVLAMPSDFLKGMPDNG